MTDPPAGLGILAPVRAGREVVDPAEPWERAVPSAVASHRARARLLQPHIPTADSEIPPGWLRAVRVATGGGVSLERTLLFPPSVRPIDRLRTRFVSTPRQLLAFGERGVALAIETRTRPMPLVIATDRIGALEDVRQLGYVRISLRAADTRLTVRADRPTRRLLDASLRGLRRRAAGRERGDVPAVGLMAVGLPDVPESWRVVAGAIAEDAGEPGAAAVFGHAPGDQPGVPTAVLVAITGTELLVLADGDEVASPGVLEPDMLAFPRRLLQEVCVDGDRLVVRSGGVNRAIRLGLALATAATDLVESAGQARTSAAP